MLGGKPFFLGEGRKDTLVGFRYYGGGSLKDAFSPYGGGTTGKWGRKERERRRTPETRSKGARGGGTEGSLSAALG